MSLDPSTIDALAGRILSAQDHARTMAKLTDEYPTMTIADAYAVQRQLARRWQARGERIIGLKAGLTSRAKMEQMGIDVPSFGILSNTMARPENSAIEFAELVHPRVEAEIAVVTRHRLGGTGLTLHDIVDAMDFVIPAIEVIDSRYEKFKFDLVSVIADNGSAARYVTGGRPRDPREIDLRLVGVVIEKNGVIQAVGAGAAVLNHPFNAVIRLVEHLAAQGEDVPAGTLVLTGGITAAIPVAAGDSIVARFQDMGSVSVRFA